MLDGEEEFSASHISLWPEDDAPQSLQEILCPGGRVSEVQAMLGDEGLIYMAGPPGDYGERAIVFVSFDPTFGFEGMTRPDGTPVHEKKKDKTLFSTLSLAKKRKSFSDGNDEEKAKGLEPSQDQHQAESKDGDTSDLADRTKRAKTDDQATNETLSSPLDIDCTPSTTSMTTLVPTPSGWPPPLPSPQTTESFSSASGNDEASTKPSSVSSSSSSSSSSSTAPPLRDLPDNTASSSSTESNPAAGLLTWREKASYLTLANGIWTR